MMHRAFGVRSTSFVLCLILLGAQHLLHPERTSSSAYASQVWDQTWQRFPEVWATSRNSTVADLSPLCSQWTDALHHVTVDVLVKAVEDYYHSESLNESASRFCGIIVAEALYSAPLSAALQITPPGLRQTRQFCKHVFTEFIPHLFGAYLEDVASVSNGPPLPLRSSTWHGVIWQWVLSHKPARPADVWRDALNTRAFWSNQHEQLGIALHGVSESKRGLLLSMIRVAHAMGHGFFLIVAKRRAGWPISRTCEMPHFFVATLAFSHTDVTEALRLCSAAPQPYLRSACAGGVFHFYFRFSLDAAQEVLDRVPAGSLFTLCRSFPYASTCNAQIRNLQTNYDPLVPNVHAFGFPCKGFPISFPTNATTSGYCVVM